METIEFLLSTLFFLFKTLLFFFYNKKKKIYFYSTIQQLDRYIFVQKLYQVENKTDQAVTKAKSCGTLDW